MNDLVDFNYDLLHDVHVACLPPTTAGDTYTVQGSYLYYHYGCDKLNDRGWGCGYRTLQTICSWLKKATKSEVEIPSIPNIQCLLVQLEDKPKSFIASREWIGTVEAGLIIDHLFEIPCKILHINQGLELHKYKNELIDYFRIVKCPLMMGGNKDCSSKGIFGIHNNGEETYLLVVDPHFTGIAKNPEMLVKESWVKWINFSDFIDTSFYNLCMPQVKHI